MASILETQRGKLTYSISGKGFPILLLAGGPGINANYLEAVVENLALRNQVILLHQRGTDVESRQKDDLENINLNAYVEDIEDLRKHLSIKQWNILGHSWGGLLASIYSCKFSKAINKLILVNTAGLTFEIYEQLMDNVLQRLSGEEYTKATVLAAKMMSTDGERYAVEFFKTVSSAYFYDKKIAAKFSEKVDESFLSYPTFGLMIQDVVSSKLNIKEEASNFINPVLYISARQDIVGFQVYHDIINSYPNLHIKVIEKAGHYCWLEQPDLFYESVDSFLCL